MSNQNNLETIFSRSTCFSDYGEGYIDYLCRCLKGLDLSQVEKIVSRFEEARLNKRTIFFIGNGGSAATCSHFANDLTLLTRETSAVPYRAVSLCDNNAIITAIGNDCGFENLFAQQLENLAKEGDLLVVISASGKSKNLIRAIRYAKEKQLITIGFAGFSGGLFRDICDEFLYFPSKEGEYGPAEDMALIIDHLVSSYLAYKIYGGQLGLRPAHAGY